MAGRDGRSRNWNLILYPDSAPEKWRDIIDETHIEWVESPLHDKDVDPDGEIKKSHYHVSLFYPSDKSFEQVQDLVCKELNQPIPIKCQSVKGSIRYMVHKDNPDKFQYNWNDIVCHGGADLVVLCSPTNTERLQLQLDIIKYIEENNILEFRTIVNYSIANHLQDWTNLLLNFSTISIEKYIGSKRNEHREAKEKAKEEALYTPAKEYLAKIEKLQKEIKEEKKKNNAID
jgi:hypothetical protein